VACDTLRTYREQTPQEREAEIRAALAKLEQRLTGGQVRVTISPQGAIAFAGWQEDRGGVTDACAYRALTATGSWALRQAVARAESMSGRKVSERALLAGVHSHDGGKTWHGGHGS